MKYSTQIRPISYLKAHTAEIIRSMSQQADPIIITQNGEAKVVLQDIKTYEKNQETLALLKILLWVQNRSKRAGLCLLIIFLQKSVPGKG